ncbi:MAG: single-stranded-DNA-specific exonuclease RecJ [Chloroflexi bacterium]|nr:single-stranded-DNA-specific exonuclease RecJ [Chloroflexota bacterium]
MMMVREPLWDPPPKRAPQYLFEELSDIPPLVVHLAAYRWRRSQALLRALEHHLPANAVEQIEEALNWPSADVLYQYINETLSCSLPLSKTPRMREAAQRIRLAFEQKEPIGIFGDYDADGISAAAILDAFLTTCGAKVHTKLPQRSEGYGLQIAALEAFHQDGFKVVIAIDCGINAYQTTGAMPKLGIDLIVVDHHEPNQELAETPWLINPKLPDGDSHDLPLAAAGLAYRLCCILADEGIGERVAADSLLDLVALGTVADVVPLIGLNRLLVARGLAALRESRRPGIIALCEVAQIPRHRITTHSIAFHLAPRINAVGRLDHCRPAFLLLRTNDPDQAHQLAQKLQQANNQRQQLTKAIVSEAEQQIEPVLDQQLLLFAIGESWHPGVLGLVAGKLKEKYHRPSFVFTRTSGKEAYHGSARSINGFNLAEVIQRSRDYLSGGGHSLAAGIAIRSELLTQAKQHLEQLAHELLTEEDLRIHYRSDAKVRLATLKPDLVRKIEQLGPFGTGNEDIRLFTPNVVISRKNDMGNEYNGLIIRLREQNIERRGIIWSPKDTNIPPPGTVVDILFCPRVDEFQGMETVELEEIVMRQRQKSSE